MSGPTELPDVRPGSLREVATEARVERVWKRVESDLVGESPRLLHRPSVWAWAPAAMVIVFASGVFVGSTWVRDESLVSTAFRAEEVAPPSGPPTTHEVTQSPSDDGDKGNERKRSPRVHRQPGPTPELVVAPESVDPSVPAPAPAPATPPEWQQLFYEGEFDSAREAIERQGGFDAVVGQASPEQLMALSGLARESRDGGRAIEALRRVVSIYPGDPNAPDAAYQLGLLLKKSGDLAGAAQAFASYRALSPDGDFSEDALASQVEAAIEAGELPLARQLAEQYAREFPTGDRLDEFREELAARAAADAAEAEAEEAPAAPPVVDDDGADDAPAEPAAEPAP